MTDLENRQKGAKEKLERIKTLFREGKMPFEGYRATLAETVREDVTSAEMLEDLKNARG
jgi:hypothetical protein